MPQVHRRLDVLKAEAPRAGVQPQLPSRTPAAATERHPLVRDGLKAALAALPGVHVVAEAATGQAAVREALLHRPDVVVMDLQMPEGNGIEATRQLGRALPSAPAPLGEQQACSGSAREPAAGLTDSRPKTHPEFRPAGATRCQSLPLAGRAILEPDLHEWLFLLVTA
jgi:CheY-like chemotaxis protein